MEIIEKVGYKEPTPIQRQAIPIGFQVNYFNSNLSNLIFCNFIYIFRIVILSVLLKLVLVKHWLTLYRLLNGSNLYLKWKEKKTLIK